MESATFIGEAYYSKAKALKSMCTYKPLTFGSASRYLCFSKKGKKYDL